MICEKSADVIVVFQWETKDRTILNLGKQGGIDIPYNRRKHRGKDRKMATYGEISWK